MASLYLKSIPGYPNYYATIDGNILVSKDGKSFNLMTFTETKKGYFTVMIKSHDNHSHRRKVHRLIALTFIPNPYNHKIVMHKDNNPRNNHISNLSWGTQSDNMKQMVRDGRQRKSKIMEHTNYVKKLLHQGFSVREIQKVTTFSKTSIYRVLKRIKYEKKEK